jgi:hypothetical protein
MEPTIPFTENLDLLECCKISISLESDLFDNFEDTASEAEMSDFDLNDLQQIDAIITDTTDSSEHVIESEEILIYVTDCPINEIQTLDRVKDFLSYGLGYKTIV